MNYVVVPYWRIKIRPQFCCLEQNQIVNTYGVKYYCVSLFQPKYLITIVLQGLTTGSVFWHHWVGTGLENIWRPKIPHISWQMITFTIYEVCLQGYRASLVGFVSCISNSLQQLRHIVLFIWNSKYLLLSHFQFSGRDGLRTKIKFLVRSENGIVSVSGPGLQPKMNKKLESLVSWSC